MGTFFKLFVLIVLFAQSDLVLGGGRSLVFSGLLESDSDTDTTNTVAQSMPDARVLAGEGGLYPKVATKHFLYGLVPLEKNRVPLDRVDGPATKTELYKELARLSGEVKPEDSVTLYIDNHGFGGDTKMDFLSSGFVALKPQSKRESSNIFSSDKNQYEEITHSELLEFIDKKVKSKLKLIGGYCYSGGLHEISFKKPQVCSLSATDARSLSHGSIAYSFLGDSKSSLWDLRQNTESIYIHNLEGGRVQLSSMAWVHKKLKIGAYNEDNTQSFSHMANGEYLWSIFVGGRNTEERNKSVLDWVNKCLEKFKTMGLYENLASILLAGFSTPLYDSNFSQLPKEVQEHYKLMSKTSYVLFDQIVGGNYKLSQDKDLLKLFTYTLNELKDLGDIIKLYNTGDREAIATYERLISCEMEHFQ